MTRVKVHKLLLSLVAIAHYTDFGRILGVVYTHSASCSATGLHYLILLDQGSPSHSITHYDFAFEEDIEPLNPPPLA